MDGGKSVVSIHAPVKARRGKPMSIPTMAPFRSRAPSEGATRSGAVRYRFDPRAVKARAEALACLKKPWFRSRAPVKARRARSARQPTPQYPDFDPRAP